MNMIGRDSPPIEQTTAAQLVNRLEVIADRMDRMNNDLSNGVRRLAGTTPLPEIAMRGVAPEANGFLENLIILCERMEESLDATDQQLEGFQAAV